MNDVESFKANYNSLLKSLKGGSGLRSIIEYVELKDIVDFCNYFKTDDRDLFMEFQQIRHRGGKLDKIVLLYAKQYNLDPEKDMDKIAEIAINNILNNGFSFHFANKEDTEGFQKEGIKPGINETRREIRDVISKISSPETVQKFFVFERDNPEGKFYYSMEMTPSDWYGHKPEWILNMKENMKHFEEFTEGESDETKRAIKELYEKYSNRYKEEKRILVMFPNREVINNIDAKIFIEAAGGAQDAIAQLALLLIGNHNETTLEPISKENLIIIDEETKEIVPERKKDTITMRETMGIIGPNEIPNEKLDEARKQETPRQILHRLLDSL